MFINWFWKPWWIPTEKDREKWRKEDKERAEKQYPEEYSLMIKKTEAYQKCIDELYSTLNENQKELFNQAKLYGNEAQFHKTRADILVKSLTTLSSVD